MENAMAPQDICGFAKKFSSSGGLLRNQPVMELLFLVYPTLAATGKCNQI
jgi:hypothetical protein